MTLLVELYSKVVVLDSGLFVTLNSVLVEGTEGFTLHGGEIARRHSGVASRRGGERDVFYLVLAAKLQDCC